MFLGSASLLCTIRRPFTSLWRKERSPLPRRPSSSQRRRWRETRMEAPGNGFEICPIVFQRMVCLIFSSSITDMCKIFIQQVSRLNVRFLFYATLLYSQLGWKWLNFFTIFYNPSFLWSAQIYRVTKKNSEYLGVLYNISCKYFFSERLWNQKILNNYIICTYTWRRNFETQSMKI